MRPCLRGGRSSPHGQIFFCPCQLFFSWPPVRTTRCLGSELGAGLGPPHAFSQRSFAPRILLLPQKRIRLGEIEVRLASFWLQFRRFLQLRKRRGRVTFQNQHMSV